MSGWDWMDGIGLDGWLSYTAVTPRASLKSDANKYIDCNSDHPTMIAMVIRIPVHSFKWCSIITLRA